MNPDEAFGLLTLFGKLGLTIKGLEGRVEALEQRIKNEEATDGPAE